MDGGGVGPRVAVIGAGRAGRQFAEECLHHSLEVTLEDVLPVNLRRAQEELGDTTRLRLAESVEDAVRDADIVVDFVPDELESKLEIFSLVDRMAPPRTILLTPTEALSIADLASCTYRSDRCVAVSGLGMETSSVLVTYPECVDPAALALVQALLNRLGLKCTTIVDTGPSALTNRRVLNS